MGQIGFARARRAYHQNIALLKLHVIRALFIRNPFIMIVDRNCKRLFSFILPYNVLIQRLFYFSRLGKIYFAYRVIIHFRRFFQRLQAIVYAFIADKNSRRAGHQSLYLLARAVAESTSYYSLVVIFRHLTPPLMSLDDIIYQPVFQSFLSRKEMIPLNVLLYAFNRLPCAFGKYTI